MGAGLSCTINAVYQPVTASGNADSGRIQVLSDAPGAPHGEASEHDTRRRDITVLQVVLAALHQRSRHLRTQGRIRRRIDGGGRRRGNRKRLLLRFNPFKLHLAPIDKLFVGATKIDRAVHHADEIRRCIHEEIFQSIERHIPAEYREGFVFHAHELFNGTGKVFDSKDPQNPRWPIERRLKIADDLAAVPKKFDLPLAFGWVEKSKFPVANAARAHFFAQNKSEQLVITHVCAFMSCALQVEHWMRAKAQDEICMMIVEDNEQARANSPKHESEGIPKVCEL